MLDHLAIDVSDLARSRAFYEQALAPLGYVLRGVHAKSIAFGSATPAQAATSLTLKANKADAVCDNALRGLFGHVKNQLSHFDPLVAEAAYRVNVICESFKDLPSRGRNSQTQGEEQLLNELEKVKADVETIGLTGWANHLNDAHKAYLAVNTDRNAEDDSQPEINMRDARLATDVAYKALIDRINAYITIDGGAAYSSFVTRLNGRISDFNTTIAQRKGRKKKDDTDTAK